MSVRKLCTQAAVILTFGLAACGEPGELLVDPTSSGDGAAEPATASEGQALVTNKVLILTSLVSGTPTSSQEYAAVQQLGFVPELANPTQWAAKTTADFATYRAIILGDPRCNTNPALLTATAANRTTWAPAVNGNVIIVGTSPVFHQGSSSSPGNLTKDAIAFAAAKPNKTGMYISLSCYYMNVTTVTPVPLLDQFGTFTVTKPTSCYNNVHLTASDPAISRSTDANLSNWGCSVKEAFDSFPTADFSPLAIARNPTSTRLPGSIDLPDGTSGPAYMLVRGAPTVRCGNSVVDPFEQCDLGAQNGTPGAACSLACRTNWCGNGVEDPGEQCDLGADNGTEGSTCTSFCRSFSTNRPPQARCKNITLVANATCGASGSIDNGSSDPDDNLLGCTQTPPGPYNEGNTPVTLKCTDTGGLLSTCTGVVTVIDQTPPTIACPQDSTAECTGLVAVTNAGTAVSNDNCGGQRLINHGDREYSLGTTSVTFTRSDNAGHTTSCSKQITVVDTQGPVITLNGNSRINLECARDTYTEYGAVASDQCYGDVSTTLTTSGSVDTRRPDPINPYPITYTAYDPEGLSSTNTRDVFVLDRLPPTIEMTGGNPYPFECGTGPYSDPGYLATDACWGDVSSRVRVDAKAVRPDVPGRYSVDYQVRDFSELLATAKRTVDVVDTLAPEITCPAPSAAECISGGAVVDPGPANARDLCALASVTPNVAANFPVGTTAVPYTATDRVGHSATCNTAVTVFDSLPPTLDLNGEVAPTLQCGVDEYIEAGARAADICFGDITDRIEKVGAVNSRAIGFYPLDYSVADPEGNRSETKRRSVTVHDTLKPRMTIEGQNPRRLECGVEPYDEQGISADDACFGNISEDIVADSSSVNYQVEGTYSVNYSVADGAGNSETAVRTVNVDDALYPDLILNGGENVRVECNKLAPPWLDPGYVATDACYGNLTSQVQKSGTVNTAYPNRYPITYSVTDGAGLTTTKTRNVDVYAPPPIIIVRPTANLWPPNHQMYSFTLSDCATVRTQCADSIDLNRRGEIISIYSDEPEDARGGGDGSTDNDIVITGPASFQIRGERQGGSNGRAYGINFRVRDATGNEAARGFCRYVIHHDSSARREAIDDGPEVGYTVYRQ